VDNEIKNLAPQLQRSTAITDSRLSPALRYVSASWHTESKLKVAARADMASPVFENSIPPFNLGRSWRAAVSKFRFGFQEYRPLTNKVVTTSRQPKHTYTRFFFGPLLFTLPGSSLELGVILGIVTALILVVFALRSSGSRRNP